MCNAHYTLQETGKSKTKTNFQRLPSSEHVVHNQHYRWISGCSGASMCATLTQEQQYISGIHFELNVKQNNARWEKMQNVLMLGNIWVVGGASEVLRCPLWGSELPGISGKYPRVSGVSIPQISSYIHVTPHLCGRGTLNSVTYQIPRLPYLRPEVHNVS